MSDTYVEKCRNQLALARESSLYHGNLENIVDALREGEVSLVDLDTNTLELGELYVTLYRLFIGKYSGEPLDCYERQRVDSFLKKLSRIPVMEPVLSL